MSKKKTYREHKLATKKAMPRRDPLGMYKDRNDRFFLSKATQRGKAIHPAAVVGEQDHRVLYVLVTHKTGGRYGEYGDPNPNAGRGKDGKPAKVGLNHAVQQSSDAKLWVNKKYSDYRHEPIDPGLDKRVRKYRDGLLRKKDERNKK